jgi:hypothetical protein
VESTGWSRGVLRGFWGVNRVEQWRTEGVLGSQSGGSRLGVEQWRTEGVLGSQPPPEIPKL